MRTTILSLFLLMAGLSRAQDADKPDHWDLIKLVFPDLEERGDKLVASHSVPVRSGVREESAEEFDRELVVGLSESQSFRAAGRKHVAMLLTVDGDDLGSPLLLAVVDVSSQPRIVDVVDVRSDQSCWFWKEHEPLALNRYTDVIAVQCTHHNSSQGYSIFAFLAVIDGWVTEVATVFLLNERGLCGQNFEQSLTVSTTQARGNRFRGFTVAVKAVAQPDEAEWQCERPSKGETRYYRANYSWSKRTGAFMTNSKQIEALAARNGAKM